MLDMIGAKPVANLAIFSLAGFRISAPAGFWLPRAVVARQALARAAHVSDLAHCTALRPQVCARVSRFKLERCTMPPSSSPPPPPPPPLCLSHTHARTRTHALAVGQAFGVLVLGARRQ